MINIEEPDFDWVITMLRWGNVCMYVYLFLRARERQTDRQSLSGGRTETEEDTESQGGSRLCADSSAGLEPRSREIMT